MRYPLPIALCSMTQIFGYFIHIYIILAFRISRRYFSIVVIMLENIFDQYLILYKYSDRALLIVFLLYKSGPSGPFCTVLSLNCHLKHWPCLNYMIYIQSILANFTTTLFYYCFHYFNFKKLKNVF